MEPSNDGERTVAWVDYLLASSEPADQELVERSLALSWAYSQTLQWATRRPALGELTDEILAKLTAQAAACEAVQGRIHRRGVELQEAGRQPADEATAAAWHARLISLCPTQPEADPVIYRA